MKTIIHTPLAPAPIGPYSQAVLAGNMLFVSGQVCIDPKTNQLDNSDIPTEAARVMVNISNLLNEAGFDFSHVVKTSIFLSDMNHFAVVNQVYSTYFKGDFPARETVAVLGLPKNVNIEISVIACKF